MWCEVIINNAELKIYDFFFVCYTCVVCRGSSSSLKSLEAERLPKNMQQCHALVRVALQFLTLDIDVDFLWIHLALLVFVWIGAIHGWQPLQIVLITIGIFTFNSIGSCLPAGSRVSKFLPGKSCNFITSNSCAPLVQVMSETGVSGRRFTPYITINLKFFFIWCIFFSGCSNAPLL